MVTAPGATSTNSNRPPASVTVVRLLLPVTEIAAPESTAPVSVALTCPRMIPVVALWARTMGPTSSVCPGLSTKNEPTPVYPARTT